MQTPAALDLIRKAVQEIPHLKSLNYKNNEFPLWCYKVQDILGTTFGKDSDEYRRFTSSLGQSRSASFAPVIDFSSGRGVAPEAEFQQEYVENLTQYEIDLKSILQKYEVLGIPAKAAPSRTGVSPQVFIAHGGDSEALDKLCEFLRALGVEPVVAEKAPSEGRSVDQNVEWCLDRADCAVILATKGDIDGKKGAPIPRANVLNEVGRCEERLPGKIIYLLEEGTQFPSNISGKVRERFTQDNMERAFIKVARELVAFGLLKAAKGV